MHRYDITTSGTRLLKIGLTFLFLNLFTPDGFSQLGIRQTEDPSRLDTIFYPFYNGVQMIEIDNVGYWEDQVNFKERTQPRALEWSSLIPYPGPNVYLFRNKSGEIVKAYNTHLTLDTLSYLFRTVPLDKKSTDIVHQLLPYHGKKDGIYGGFKIRDFTSSGYFAGYYRVYSIAQPKRTTETPVKIPFHFGMYPGNEGIAGLIDSLGNLVLDIEYNSIYPVKNDKHHIFIGTDSGFGIITPFKDTIVPPVYDNYKAETERIKFFKDGVVSVVYNKQGQTVEEVPRYDYIAQESIGRSLIMVRRNWKYGFIDSTFQEVVPPIYDYLWYPYKDYPICAFDGNKWGYLDHQGKPITEFEFDDAQPFKIDNTALVKKNGSYYCIGLNGQKAANCTQHNQWFHVYEVKHSNLRIVHRGTYGILAPNDRIVVPLIYEGIQQIRFYEKKKESEKLRFIAKRQQKAGIIDEKGNVLLEFKYGRFHQFTQDGYCLVETAGRFGLIDSNFNEVFPCEYISLGIPKDGYCIFEPVPENHPANRSVSYLSPRPRGIMNLNGDIIVPAEYDQIWNYSEGLFCVKKDQLFGFVDLNGKVAIPIQYEQTGGRFRNGRVAFKQGDKWGYLNKLGEVVVAPQYLQALEFENNVTAVKAENGKYQLIDLDGNRTSGHEYDEVSYSWNHGKYLRVVRDGKTGIVDRSGKEIVECKYDRMFGIYPDYYEVMINGQKTKVKF